MDFKVVWSPSARLDLREIVEFIAIDDLSAAERIGRALLQASKALASFPKKGRVVPEFGDESLREIHLRPFRIVYRIIDEPKTVEIVRIWHSARGKPRV